MEQRKKRGRPKGYSPGKRFTVLTQIMLTPDQSAGLKALATRESDTVSGTIRKAINEALRHEEANTKAS